MATRIWRSLNRWKLTIGYVFLAAGVIVALQISLNNQDRLEQEAVKRAELVERNAAEAARQNCETANDLKDVQRDVLLVMVGDPGRDGYQRRLGIFRKIEPLLVHSECPPIPPYGDEEGN